MPVKQKGMLFVSVQSQSRLRLPRLVRLRMPASNKPVLDCKEAILQILPHDNDAEK
jgi:hypothetical protein